MKPIQAQVDLHGLRSDAAREALSGFIRDARRAGWRCVRVVHGKGPDADPSDTLVRIAMRGWGYVDNKTSAVSDKLTATRYVRSAPAKAAGKKPAPRKR